MAKKHTFNFGRLKLFVLIGVLIYASVTFVNQQSVLASQLDRQNALVEKEEALKRDIEYYKNELDYIGTDDYVEQEARTRFGWLKPGETKYVEGSSSEPVAEASSESASKDSTPTEAPPPEESSAEPSPTPSATESLTPTE